jgi:protein ImuA
MIKTDSNTFLTKKEYSPSLIELWPNINLALGRVHEACGPNRRSLAMMIAQKLQGHIFWITPEWNTDFLHSDGVMSFINPGRLTFINPKRSEDILWTMEEILRSGIVPLVIADLPGIPALTPVRRLNLATETGTAEGKYSPLGLLLTPGYGGAPGIESRWHLAARHQGIKNIWQLERMRSRREPPNSWRLSYQAGCYTASPSKS